MGYEWTDEDRIGDERIDLQHQHLFGLFNRLSEDLAQKNSTDWICQELYKYAVFHFAEEEAFMATEQMAQAYQRMHKEEHRFFLVKLEEFKKGVPSTKVLDFLVDWIKNHIRRVDQQLAQGKK